MPRIEEWFLCQTGQHLYGKINGLVYDHPNHKDGALIVTGPIVCRDGNSVVTKSGASYELGVCMENYSIYDKETLFSKLVECKSSEEREKLAIQQAEIMSKLCVQNI